MKGNKRKDPNSYVHRLYRNDVQEDSLASFVVKVKDTDLHILADTDMAQQAEEAALRGRLQVEDYINKHPSFVSSLIPLPIDNFSPPLVKKMMVAGQKGEVGPMAAVAGTIAEYVGQELLNSGCGEVVVENGGDVYIYRKTDCTVAIFAGESPLSMKIGIQLQAEKMPLAVCTSSGTIGHSLSFGRADSVTVISQSAPLADAMATKLGNLVGKKSSKEKGINSALEIGRQTSGVEGVVIISGEQIGAVGDVEFIGLPQSV